MFARIYRELRPRAAMPSFRIEFRCFANANSFISLENKQVSVRISDALEGAPASVIEALGFILLAKLYRKPVPRKYQDRYRRYLNRKDMRRHLDLMRQQRGRKVLNPPQGEQYDLEEIFEDLNHRFFHGLMARPEMGWSRRGSRTTLGHYDPSHNVIVISKYLDRKNVPKLVVEYVVFHEMLHLRFPTEHTGTRRRIHTKDFKKAEKQFPQLTEALDLLKKL
jgi:predicted SprT family Zn-dependent metalloprotease